MVRELCCSLALFLLLGVNSLANLQEIGVGIAQDFQHCFLYFISPYPESVKNLTNVEGIEVFDEINRKVSSLEIPHFQIQPKHPDFGTNVTPAFKERMIFELKTFKPPRCIVFLILGNLANYPERIEYLRAWSWMWTCDSKVLKKQLVYTKWYMGDRSFALFLSTLSTNNILSNAFAIASGLHFVTLIADGQHNRAKIIKLSPVRGCSITFSVKLDWLSVTAGARRQVIVESSLLQLNETHTKCHFEVRINNNVPSTNILSNTFGAVHTNLRRIIKSIAPKFLQYASNITIERQQKFQLPPHFQLHTELTVNNLLQSYTHGTGFLVSHSFGVGFQSFSFVTCHAQRTVPSFLVYFEPLDFATWILTVSATLTVSFLLYIIHRTVVYRISPEVSENHAFNVSGVLLEQGANFGVLNRSWPGHLVGAFLLTSFIITNAYKGKVVTNIITPLVPDKLRSIHEGITKGFRIVLEFDEQLIYDQFPILQTQNLPVVGLHIMRTFMDLQDNFNPFILAIAKADHGRNLPKEIPDIDKAVDIITPLIFAENFWDLNRMGLEEFSKCNRSMFVAEREHVDEFVLKTRKVKLKAPLYYGPVIDNFFRGDLYWKVLPLNWDHIGIIKQRLGGLLSSYILAKELFLSRLPPIRPWVAASQIFGKAQPLTFNGNINPIFKFIAFALSASLIIFAFEQVVTKIKYHQIQKQNKVGAIRAEEETKVDQDVGDQTQAEIPAESL